MEKKHNWHIRDPAESTVPAEFPLRPLPGAANLDAGDIPSLAELGFQAPYPAPDTRGVLGMLHCICLHLTTHLPLSKISPNRGGSCHACQADSLCIAIDIVS